MNNVTRPPIPPDPYPSDVPIVFADSIINVAHTRDIMKLILVRSDLNVNNSNESKTVICGQVVMGVDTFINTCLYLNKTLNEFIAGGVISSERVQTIAKLSGISLK